MLIISNLKIITVSRLGRQGSPDSMSNSYHGNTTSCSLLQNDGSKYINIHKITQ